MTEDIPRETFAQSEGGSKKGLKISHDEGANRSSIILSSSIGENKSATFRIHLDRDGKADEIVCSDLDEACGFISSDEVLGKGWIRVKLVNMSECIELSTIDVSCLGGDLSIYLEDVKHLFE